MQVLGGLNDSVDMFRMFYTEVLDDVPGLHWLKAKPYSCRGTSV